MPISTTASRISYNGNSVTTVFSFPYRFLANGDLVVIEVSSTGVETTKTLTTHYTLTGAGDDAGGSVTMLTAPATGTTLIIYRDTDIVQETDYISGDPFPAETHERALDRLTMIAQELADDTNRTLRLSIGSPSTINTELPSPEASKLIGWNSGATGLVNYTSAPEDVVVSPFMETVLDDANAATARATLAAAPTASPALTGTPTAPTASVSTNTTQIATTEFVMAQIAATSDAYGQCKLSKSGANLLLMPCNGNKLTINGVAQIVPSVGVTLAPPATSGTTYLIYAYLVGSVMTLEASTTAHATDAITGVEIKSGAATRTLVGMARTVSSAWVDTLAQRFVATWHNRSLRSVNNTLQANRSTSSTSAVEVSIAGDRAEFICWAGDVDISHQASAQFTGAGNTLIGWTVLDGSFLTGGTTLSFGAGSGEAFYIGGRVGSTVGEGYHYVGIGGQVGTGTALWVSSQCAACASFTG